MSKNTSVFPETDNSREIKTRMPIITSRYWNMVHGAKTEDVRQDAEGMQTMRILGNNMAFFLRCKEAGQKAGIIPPEQEQFVYTNFVRG